MIPYFMFIHTISGCDTTLSIFQQGKLKYVEKFQKHSKLQYSLLIFNNESFSADDIFSVRQEFLLKLFNSPKFITSLISIDIMSSTEPLLQTKNKYN
jgi:hypothetical protein